MKKTLTAIIFIALLLPYAMGIFAFPAGAATVADSTWYDAAATTLDIYDAADLAAFAEKLASGTTFQGVTVNIKEDIDLNPDWDGTLADKADATYKWPSMTDGENSTPITSFEGNIDGKGHTISGIYYTAAYRGNDRGMLSSTGSADTVIKNFTIKKSYMTVQRWRQSALINHNGTGKLTISCVNVESDVIFEQPTADVWATASNHEIAFYVAQTKSTSGDLTISNCIFEGTVQARYACGVSAFVGRAESAVKIESCAMYGNVIGIFVYIDILALCFLYIGLRHKF